MHTNRHRITGALRRPALALATAFGAIVMLRR